MGPLDRELAQRRGQRKLDAMKRRAGQLRRRVVASAVVGFVLLWAVVFVQMATGNDPALGTGTTARPLAKKRPASAGPAGHSNLQAAVPPPGEEEEEESTAIAEPETSEVARIEAEARELEELEAVSTGQS
jgi:hypothetical protein